MQPLLSAQLGNVMAGLNANQDASQHRADTEHGVTHGSILSSERFPNANCQYGSNPREALAVTTKEPKFDPNSLRVIMKQGVWSEKEKTIAWESYM